MRFYDASAVLFHKRNGQKHDHNDKTLPENKRSAALFIFALSQSKGQALKTLVRGA